MLPVFPRGRGVPGRFLGARPTPDMKPISGLGSQGSVSKSIGSHRLGERLTRSAGGREPIWRLRKSLKGWAHWRGSEVGDAQICVVPVPLYDSPNCRDWYLVTVLSAVESEWTT